MTIALGTPVQNSVATAGAGALTISLPLAAGDSAYVVACTESAGSTTMSVSDGTAYTAIDSSPVYDSTNAEALQQFYRQNPGAGTYTVSMTPSASEQFRGIVGIPISGGKLVGILDVHGPGNVQAAPTTGTDLVTSGTAQTPTAQPGVIIAVSMDTGASSAGAPSAGSGFTSLGTFWTFGGAVPSLLRIEYLRFTSLAAVQGLFTALANEHHITTMAVFLEAVGGPTITSQPSNAHVMPGSTATFSVTASASGGGSLTYQWKLNGTNISGATSSSFTTAALALSDDNGLYSCDVTETGGTSPGTTTSSSATLRVGIIRVAIGTAAFSASAGTTVAPTHPAGIQSGDLILYDLCQKPSTANSGSVTTPSGLTLESQITGATDGNTGGYTTTLGSQTGNVNAYRYSKTAAGSESGTTQSFTLATNNVTAAIITVYRAPPGYAISLAHTTGKDTTTGTALSIAGAANPGVAANDVACAFHAGPTDYGTTATFSAEAFAQTGATFGTVTELYETGTTTGNRCGFVGWDATVTAGTASAAPTWSGTAAGTTTNVRGPGIFTRIRATSSSSAAALTNSATVSATATGKGTLAATPANAATVSGTLSAGLACTLTNSAACTPALTAKGTLTCGPTNAATVSASLTAAGNFAAGITAGANCTATLLGLAAIAATPTNSAGVSATGTRAVLGAGSLTNAAACTATVGALGTLATSLVSSAAVSATLGSGAGAAASITDSVSVAGTLGGAGTLQGSTTNAAAVSAAVVGLAPVACSSAASASCSPTLSARGSLSAACTNVATSTATLSAIGILACAVNNSSVCTPTLTARGALVSSLVNGAGVTATLLDGAGQSAFIANTATCNAALTARGALASSVTDSAICTGTATGLGGLVAACAAGASCAPALSALGALAASTTAGAACTGTLTNGVGQSATIGVGATIGATISAIGNLFASIPNGAAPSAQLTGIAACIAGLACTAACTANAGGFSPLVAALAVQASLNPPITGWAAIGAVLACSAACTGTTKPYSTAALGVGASCSATLTAPGPLSAAASASAAIAALLGVAPNSLPLPLGALFFLERQTRIFPTGKAEDDVIYNAVVEDPDEDLDFGFDLGLKGLLEEGETIATVTWSDPVVLYGTAPTSPVIQTYNPSRSQSVAKIWAKNVAREVTYLVKATILTTFGRTYVRKLTLSGAPLSS